jgi:transcriptional regulator with XRE-family HTH domain
VNLKLNKLKLWEKLSDPGYRKDFVSSTISARLAVRIFNLRKKFKWSQNQLAENAGMKQARISLLEQGDYENFTFSTLRKIAAAFDVAIIVDFVSFPDFLTWSEDFSPDSLVPNSFEDSMKSLELRPRRLFGQSRNILDDDQGAPSMPEITRELYGAYGAI